MTEADLPRMERIGRRMGQPVGRRLSVQPKTADRTMLWLAIGAVVATIILSLLRVV